VVFSERRGNEKMMMKPPSRLEARFKNNPAAEFVKKAVTDTLSSAEKEVTALFERGGGVADSHEVSAVYKRYGFYNDCGWQQSRPIFVEGSTLFWEIPDGMLMEEAEQLLVALGALSVRREDYLDEDLLKNVPHPAALFLSELEELQDFDDDDIVGMEGCDKKTIH
jgi:hypothetical protein